MSYYFCFVLPMTDVFINDENDSLVIIETNDRLYGTFNLQSSKKCSPYRDILFVLSTISFLIFVVLSNVEYTEIMDNKNNLIGYSQLLFNVIFRIFLYASYTVSYLVAFPELNKWICIHPIIFAGIYVSLQQSPHLIQKYKLFDIPTSEDVIFRIFSLESAVNNLMVLILQPLIIWRILGMSIKKLCGCETFVYILMITIISVMDTIPLEGNGTGFDFLRFFDFLSLTIILSFVYKLQEEQNDKMVKLHFVIIFNLFNISLQEITYLMRDVFIYNNMDNYSISPLMLLIAYNIGLEIVRYNASFILTKMSYSVYPFFFSIFTFFKIYISVMIINTIPKQSLQILFWCLVISCMDIIMFIISIENISEKVTKSICVFLIPRIENKICGSFVVGKLQNLINGKPLSFEIKTFVGITDNIVVSICHLYALVVLITKFFAIQYISDNDMTSEKLENTKNRFKTRIISQTFYLVLSLCVIMKNSLYIKTRDNNFNFDVIFKNLQFYKYHINLVIFSLVITFTYMMLLYD
jgi:hypothetical protein